MSEPPQQADPSQGSAPREPEPPPEVVALAEARAAARAQRTFDRADELRDELAAAGWAVRDEPGGGFALTPMAPEVDGSDDRRDEPAVDVSLHWVFEGWPGDIDRAIAGFRAHAGSWTMQFVVADVTGQRPGRWGADVEVVSLPPGTGWATARNAGLERNRGAIVLVLDGSVEPVGDVVTPLAAALADPQVGFAGPFGLVTTDLRRFDEAPGPGPCDALEGYLIAMRREVLERVGGADERFRWYRNADIEWSFRVKDAGLRTEVVEVPVTTHEHRAWASTSLEDRERLSRRNFNRFLDRWRDRWDLVLAGEPARGAGPPSGAR